MDEYELKMTPGRTVAFIPMRGAYGQVPDAMGRLYGWIAQHGLRPEGMPSAAYLSDPEAGPESEAVWEVRAEIAGGASASEPDDAGVGVRTEAARLVASTLYRGPYEQMAPVYHALQEWIDANGYRTVGAPEEVYMSDPATTRPEEYLTEIRFPVAKRSGA